MSYLLNILKRIDLPKEASKQVLEAYTKIKNKDEINKVLKLYQDESVNFPKVIANWRPVLRKYKINQYIGDLLFCLLLSKKTEALYKKRKLPMSMFNEMIQDFRYKTIECKLVKHTWGIFATPWYGNFLKLRLFSLGRLQFEIHTFMADYNSHDVHLRMNQPCLNVHIPRNETPLDINECKKSIDRAKKFFKPYFNKYILFSCNSWLLSDVTLRFVSKDSNIHRFSKLFKIFKNIYLEDQSKDMWRLFDDDASDLSKLKADTSLRKKYLRYLKQGGKASIGLGFFIYNF